MKIPIISDGKKNLQVYFWKIIKTMTMFVAINYISCSELYQDRFEQLMRSRTKAVDNMPGFQRMEVLKPNENGSDYLIISHWEKESDFQAWRTSGAFLEGHKRGFKDLSKAKTEGKTPPMKSTFKTYEILAQ
ncbi:MAG: antibiotic biosynthesis monooxygenase [Bacteroidales bacterium]|nr:antibiotic biosynthesis monooxygenase [Bacteroidales bacterium]